ncbi:MAG: hypothetical protein RSG50_11810, partial [Clostridia bacterium]
MVYIGKGGVFEITNGTMEIACNTANDFQARIKGDVVLKKKMPIRENDVLTIESGSLTVASGALLNVDGTVEVNGTLAMETDESWLTMSDSRKLIFRKDARMSDAGTVYIGKGGVFEITDGTM